MIQLKIPQPCTEQWTSMTPVGVDCRYCAQCHKNIVDFTFKSDTEILRHMQENEGRICGRFSPDQLQRTLHSANKHGRGIQAFAVGFLGLFALPAGAQQYESIHISQPAQKNIVKPVIQDTLFRTITGRILDPYTDQPVYAATVQYRGFGTTTDLDGIFSLRVPISALQHLEEGLTISYVGSNTLNIPLPERILHEDLALKSNYLDYSSVLMGEIVVVAPKNPWNRIKSFFYRLFN
ncbi:MAG TPA: hypothetical protein DCF33_00705 [Saprospirales bacterium]|nr:hypothetical protein [Saprospirales bacterium]